MLPYGQQIEFLGMPGSLVDEIGQGVRNDVDAVSLVPGLCPDGALQCAVEDGHADKALEVNLVELFRILVPA